MSSSKEYLNYLMDSIGNNAHVRARAMMGEFLLYYREKLIGGVYDNRLLLKPVDAAKKMLPSAEMVQPYDGAKEMLLVDNTDNGEFLNTVFEAMYDELPEPKKKR